LINKYKTETIGWEKSLSLVLFHGKQTSAEPGDKTKHKRVEQKGTRLEDYNWETTNQNEIDARAKL
jgi:hypothetical protein